MDDDLVDLLVVSGVAGIGFIALAYIVTKTYSDKIKRHLLCFKNETRHLITAPHVATVGGSKSALVFRKFDGTEGIHTETSEKILTRSVEILRKQVKKRVRIGFEECKDTLDSTSSSNSSRSDETGKNDGKEDDRIVLRRTAENCVFGAKLSLAVKQSKMSLRENPHFQEAEEHMLEPMIRLPFVDALRRLSSKQDTHCGFFESQYYHCLEAFGQKLGRKYCDLERRDFNECITNYKQKKRAEWIKLQYKRHWDTKKHGPLPEGAKIGECVPDYFSYNPPHAIR